MIFKGLMSEFVKIVAGLRPDADALSGTKTSDYVKMALYQKLMGILYLGDATGGTATHTITVQAASDDTGTGAEAVAFKYRRCSSGDTLGDVTDATTAGFVTTAGDNQHYTIEIDAADLPEGKPWVAIKSVEATDDPVDAALIMLLGNARYSGDDLPTAISDSY